MTDLLLINGLATYFFVMELLQLFVFPILQLGSIIVGFIIPIIGKKRIIYIALLLSLASYVFLDVLCFIKVFLTFMLGNFWT